MTQEAARPPLGLLIALTISGTLSLHIMVPALPAAAAGLGVSAGAIQLALTVYVMALAIGQIVHGPLSDRFGRKPVLLAGLAMYALASFGAAMAPDLRTLLLARVAQGFGGCAGLVLGRAILRDVFPAREAASRLALLNTFMTLSPGLAPAVGGVISGIAGWRAIFLLLGGVGLCTWVATILMLKETHAPSGGGFGPLLRSFPIVLRSRTFLCNAVAGACATTAFYAFLAAAPFLFVERLHWRAEQVGLFLMAPVFGYSVGSMLAARLARRVPGERLLRLGVTAGAVGAAMLLAADLAGMLSAPVIMVAMLVFTMGGGLAGPFALTAAVSVRPEAIGAAAGLYGFMQMSFGALCTGAVAIWHQDPVRTAALVLAGSAAVAVAATALVPRRAEPV